jgi:hypothetical protein
MTFLVELRDIGERSFAALTDVLRLKRISR